MPYRVEVTKQGRAGCKGPKPCNGTKIQKGELRVGTFVQIPSGGGETRDSWQWRHWGCVTKKVLANLMNSGPLEDLDGFEDIGDEYQEKMRKAWENGEVAPDDIPESAKKPKEGEDTEAVGSSSSPVKDKKAVKKKSAKAADDEEEPKPKKAKKSKKAVTSDDDDVEPPKVRKAAKTSAKHEHSEDEEDEDEKPKTSRKAPPKKESNHAEDADLKKPKKRSRPARKTKVDDEDDD